MKIYGFPTFNLTKVLFTAEEVEQPYEMVWINPEEAEHKTASYLEKHPLGKVPCLSLNGDYFFESNNICRLLAETYQPSLYGTTATDRARINQWVDLAGYHPGRWMAVLFLQEYIYPTLLGQEPNKDAIAEAKQFLQSQLSVVNQQLSTQAYIALERFTIADIILFSYCHTQNVTSLILDPFPALTEWYNRVAARPAFSRAMKNTSTGNMF